MRASKIFFIRKFLEGRALGTEAGNGSVSPHFLEVEDLVGADGSGVLPVVLDVEGEIEVASHEDSRGF